MNKEVDVVCCDEPNSVPALLVQSACVSAYLRWMFVSSCRISLPARVLECRKHSWPVWRRMRTPSQKQACGCKCTSAAQNAQSCLSSISNHSREEESFREAAAYSTPTEDSHSRYALRSEFIVSFVWSPVHKSVIGVRQLGDSRTKIPKRKNCLFAFRKVAERCVVANHCLPDDSTPLDSCASCLLRCGARPARL